MLPRKIGRARVRQSDCCDAMTGLFDAALNHAKSRNVAEATQRDSMDHPWCGNRTTVSKEGTVDLFGSQDQSKNAKTAKNAENSENELTLKIVRCCMTTQRS